MSKSKRYSGKREPKNRKDFKGLYPFCGFMCCGILHGKRVHDTESNRSMRRLFRCVRRNQKKQAIREGLAELDKKLD